MRESESSLTSSLVAATVGVAINKAWTAQLWELSAGLRCIFDQSDGSDDSTSCGNYQKAKGQPGPVPYVTVDGEMDVCGRSVWEVSPSPPHI